LSVAVGSGTLCVAADQALRDPGGSRCTGALDQQPNRGIGHDLAEALALGTKPQQIKPRARASKPRVKPAGRTKTPARGQKKAVATRPGTKAAKILSLLQRPGGASLPDLRKATGWQAHSVRGFLSGALRKKMGLRIHSVKRNGERIYRVTK
jgi:hypothetical protein